MSPINTLQSLAQQCQSAANALDNAERTNMGTSVAMDQAVDVLRWAADALASTPELLHALHEVQHIIEGSETLHAVEGRAALNIIEWALTKAQERSPGKS